MPPEFEDDFAAINNKKQLGCSLNDSLNQVFSKSVSTNKTKVQVASALQLMETKVSWCFFNFSFPDLSSGYSCVFISSFFPLPFKHSELDIYTIETIYHYTWIIILAWCFVPVLYIITLNVNNYLRHIWSLIYDKCISVMSYV